MGLFKRVRRSFRKVVKVAAIGAAVYYGGGAALAAWQRSQAGGQQQQQGPDYSGIQQTYSTPFNPGYSYTGPPHGAGEYGGGAYGAYSGSGGAAIPSEQSGSEARSPGFAITPTIALAGAGVLLLGFLALR